MSKYLFIGAHTDDLELSCGATIAKYIEEGNEVHAVAFSYCGNDTLRQEFINSMYTLGIRKFHLQTLPVRKLSEYAQEISDLILDLHKSEKFDTVFTHDKADKHPDHSTVGLCSERVLTGCSILAYKSPFNTLVMDENFFVPVEERHIEKKWQSLQCYKSQAHRPYMNEDVMKSQCLVRGLQCSIKYAEAFKVIRWQ